MKAARHPLRRLVRDLFRIEPLESRVLLSADPVLGAAQIVLRPAEDAAPLLAEAYTAATDVTVATTPGTTVLITDNAAQLAAAPAEWLVVDSSQLAGGNGRLVVGDADGNAVIRLGQSGETMTMGGLVLLNPQAGGEVFVDGDLDLGGTLVIVGSGHTTQLTADITDVDDVLIFDSVAVHGNRTLTAGTDGTGNIQLGNSSDDFINGNGDSTADTLTLRAADNMRFLGVVGTTDPLEGLTIGPVTVTPGNVSNPPQNITFDREVNLNGDLVINATGTVSFTQVVRIHNGGDLIITGADQVVFAAGLELDGTDSGGAAGNILIEANEITFPVASESIKGTGVLTLRPSDSAFGIELGTPPASVTANTLNIDNSEITTFADGFQRIVIGHQDGVHAKAGAGSVRLGAINALDQPTLRDPLEVYGGSITVEDYSTADYTLLVQGTIRLDAVADITIRNRVEASTGAGLADITLYSATGQVRQTDATGDTLSGEALRGAALNVRAATGISLPYTEFTDVTATNAVSGDLQITETATGGDVNILLLSQSASAGGLSLKTRAGGITVNGAGLSNSGSGLTELQAAGTTKDITVNQAIASATGIVRLTASGKIATVDDAITDGTIVTGGAANVELVATGGDINQGGTIQSAGGLVSLDASGAILMTDGVVARSQATTGAISLKAGGNVTVSRLVADASFSITSTAGAIIDGLAGANPNLDGETAAVLLAAATGIGASGTPLQTRVLALAASNVTSGGIFVREATGLRIAGGAGSSALDARGTGGGISVVSADGTLTVAKAVSSTGTVGHILLQAAEAVGSTVAGLEVQADVTSSTGSISLLAADGIVVDDGAGGTAPTVSVLAATQTIDLDAGQGIVLEGLARLATAGGNARLNAQAGAVVLGVVDAGAGSVSIAATGAISDAQADDAATPPTANIIAGSLRLAAGGAIGAAGALLDTQVGTLAAQSTGAMLLAERDALTVGSVAAVNVNRVTPAGTIPTPVGDAALAGLASGGLLVLQAGGDVALNQAVQSAGTLRLGSSGSLNFTGSVSAAGNLSAVAATNITAGALALLASTAGTIDLEGSSGNVMMTDGAVARTDAKAIRVRAGGTVLLGVLDARSVADRGATSLAGQGTWGAVSVEALAIGDTAGEILPDIFAGELRLKSGSAIATGAEVLETEVALLSASTFTQGLFVTDATALTVGATGAVGYFRVGVDGASTFLTDAAQSGIASLGAAVLQTTAGALTIAGAGVTADRNVLLRSGGVASDLSVTSIVTSTGGHVSLDAGNDLLLGANVSTTGAGNTIDLRAQRHVTQAEGTSVGTTDGNLSLEAVTGNATIETLAAGTAGVYVNAVAIIDVDTGVDTEVDVGAASAQLRAAGAIGAGTNALETTVATLSARAGTSLFVTETDGLAVDLLQLQVQRVATDGTAAATAHAAQEDLAANTIVLRSLAGNLAVNAGTASTAGVTGGTGNVLLEAATGSVTVSATVDAASGNLSVLGATGVTLAATGTLNSSGGTIDVVASGGAIFMADASVVSTNAAALRLQAAGDVTVGRLDARTAADRAASTTTDVATWGGVSVVSGGSIFDNTGETAVDIQAASVRLQAVTGIGTGAEHLETEAASRLSASAGAGGVFITEATAIELGSVAVLTVQRVAADGTSAAGPSDAAQSGVASGGAVVVQTLLGSIFAQDAGVSAAGNVLLQAQGGPSDLFVNAVVSSSGGNVDLRSVHDISLGASVSTAAAGKTIQVQAQRNILQVQGTSVGTSNGNIRLVATTGSATLETLAAGTGAVAVQAASIVDGDAGANETEVDITAAFASLVATGGGIGATGAALETTVGNVAAQATGNIFLTESDALSIDTLAAFSVQDVDGAGAAAANTLTLVNGVAGADVVVRTRAGSLVIAGQGAVAATGKLLLQTDPGAFDITIGRQVSALGALSVSAGQDLIVTAVVTTEAGNGSIDLLAQGRIDAQQGSAIRSGNANVQLQALGGTVTIETVAAGTGTVRIAGTSLIDGDTAASETELDLTAGKLQVTTTNAIATGANPLETRIDVLSASAVGAVAIAEFDGLLLDTVVASVDRVALDGTSTATAPVTQSGVSGSIIVLRAGGTLESRAGSTVTGTANVLLQATGAISDLLLGAAVSSSGGNISLNAGRDLAQNANLSTAGTGRTIDVIAAGSFSQAQGVSLGTVNGNVAVVAGGVVTLETITAGAGRVGVSGSSIVDGDTTPGDTEVDIQASGLRATATGAGGSIGASGNALETTISSLTAVAGGDVFITEADALDLEVVSVNINRVAAVGTDSSVALAVQQNTRGANVVVRTLAGTLASLGTGAVTASGNVLLQAVVDINLGAAVTSTSGNVSLAAGRDLLLNAGVSATAADMTLDLVAVRDIVQAQGTQAASAGGNIALQAGGSVTVETLNAGTGAVRIAAASVADGDTGVGETEADILASGLQLVVSGATGSGANALDTSVQTLAASGGNLFLTEGNALTVGSLTVNVQRVDLGGATSATATGPVTGIATATTVVQVSAGALETQAAVTAGGNLLLAALAADADLVLGAAVSGSGDVHLSAGRDLLQNANVAATATARGLFLQAGRNLAQAEGVSAATTDGPLLARAVNGTVTLELLQAGAGTVRIEARDLVDGDADGDTGADVIAASLQVATSAAVGSSANALETTVTSLAAQAGGDIFLTETDALVIGAVNITPRRVGADGASLVDAAIALQGITSTSGAITVQTLAGTLSSTTQGAVVAAGNVTLHAGSLDVNLAGSVDSSGASVVLSADRDVITTGTVHAGGAQVSVAAARDINVAGAVSSAGTVNLVAQRNLDVNAAISADGAGDLAAAGNLVVNGPVTVASLAVSAQGNVTVLAAVRSTAGAVGMSADQAMVINGVVASAGAATLAAGGNLIVGANVTSAADLALTAHADIGVTAALASTAGNIALTADGTMTVNGPVTSSGSTSLAAGGNIGLGGNVSSGGNVALAAHGLIVTTGTVGSGGTVGMTADLDLNVDGAVSSAGTATFTAGGNLGVGSTITSAGAASLAAGRSLAVNAAVVAGGDLALAATDNISTTALTSSTGGVVGMTAGIDLTANGAIASAGATTLTAQRNLTLGGNIGAGGNVALAAHGIVGTTGAVSSGGAVAMTADLDLSVGGPVHASGYVALLAHRNLGVTAAVESTAGFVSVTADADLAMNGAVTSATTATFTAGGQHERGQHGHQCGRRHPGRRRHADDDTGGGCAQRRQPGRHRDRQHRHQRDA
jgi:hypothetical protein